MSKDEIILQTSLFIEHCSIRFCEANLTVRRWHCLYRPCGDSKPGRNGPDTWLLLLQIFTLCTFYTFLYFAHFHIFFHKHLLRFPRRTTFCTFSHVAHFAHFTFCTFSHFAYFAHFTHFKHFAHFARFHILHSLHIFIIIWLLLCLSDDVFKIYLLRSSFKIMPMVERSLDCQKKLLS